ncbi:unnamed protein product [Microthlaspi erraticum]|uniref:KIB1-4 beta-propeller domain-containing protein n=1 Tax=Microthlaspi erraticum TaxID=1685480 RepID=A0A6D2KEX1_9BRAS|nr:unnamed protein product [Microthlaspi erraticum]
MSLLLNQPPKLCFRKPVLVRSSSSSSSYLPQTLPDAIVCVDPCRPHLVTFVAKKDGDMTPLEKKAPMEVMERIGIIGTSNGWLATFQEDRVHLIEHPTPSFEFDSKSVWLPPVVTLPLCQTQMVTNMAMSSSSPEEEDFVVALKFLGPQLSFCRPAAGPYSEWINMRIENPCFFSSRIMFSKKDGVFRIPGSGGHLIGSWDLTGKQNQTPQIKRLRFENIPKMTKTKLEILDSCDTSEHLVESTTTGETFMIKWYKKTVPKTIKGIERLETKALMVFKLEEEEGHAVYTQDIGNLVIFLTKSETLCVPASSVPAMRPNHVKILDVDETAVVDLAAQM